MNKISKKNRRYDSSMNRYNFFMGQESEYPRLVRLTSFFVKVLGIGAFSAVFSKLSKINFMGIKEYYIDLLFHLSVFSFLGALFGMFIIAIYVQTNLESELVQFTIILTSLVSIALFIFSYFFLPSTVNLIKDLPYVQRHEYKVISGEINKLDKNRQGASFEIGNMSFQTESIPLRDKLGYTKRIRVIYLPHSNLIIDLSHF